MAYQHTNSKGIAYELRKQEVTLRGGRRQTIYFFNKIEQDRVYKGDSCDLPEGFMVVENPRNGFLTLKKKIVPAK